MRFYFTPVTGCTRLHIEPDNDQDRAFLALLIECVITKGSHGYRGDQNGLKLSHMSVDFYQKGELEKLRAKYAAEKKARSKR